MSIELQSLWDVLRQVPFHAAGVPAVLDPVAALTPGWRDSEVRALRVLEAGSLKSGVGRAVPPPQSSGRVCSTPFLASGGPLALGHITAVCPMVMLPQPRVPPLCLPPRICVVACKAHLRVQG